jgi:membrane carboxypeptidase/penicillin-binding protein PbpC
VLRSYLDSVYLGRNCYGIACGLSAFFHVDDLAQLSDADMIRLIALFRYPNTKRTDEALYGRWSRWIASHTSVTLTGGTIQFRPYLPFNLFPHVTRLALETCDRQSWCFQLQSVDESLTIDARLQRLAIQQSQDILSSLSGKNVTNAAVYAFRPHTGDILVYQ